VVDRVAPTPVVVGRLGIRRQLAMARSVHAAIGGGAEGPSLVDPRAEEAEQPELSPALPPAEYGPEVPAAEESLSAQAVFVDVWPEERRQDELRSDEQGSEAVGAEEGPPAPAGPSEFQPHEAGSAADETVVPTDPNLGLKISLRDPAEDGIAETHLADPETVPSLAPEGGDNQGDGDQTGELDTIPGADAPAAVREWLRRVVVPQRGDAEPPAA
jgi:hypothetical protein